MKLMIDIDKEKWEYLKTHYIESEKLYYLIDIVKNGIPLDDEATENSSCA